MNGSPFRGLGGGATQNLTALPFRGRGVNSDKENLAITRGDLRLNVTAVDRSAVNGTA